jgi:hypothetical protein
MPLILNYTIHRSQMIDNIYTEIPAFEFKLTANKSYGVGTVGDRLGAGVKVDRGCTTMFFCGDTFVLTAE